MISMHFIALYRNFIHAFLLFRDRIFKLRERNQGLKCLLRSDMLKTYYKRCDEKKIRQHELENFEDEYQAYKALGGNSFIDKIHNEVLSRKPVT